MTQEKPDAPTGGQGKLVQGVLELCQRSDAFLRDLKRHLVPRSDDPIVPRDAVRKLGLRGGELLVGALEGNGKRRGARRLSRIEQIDGIAVGDWLPPTPLNETTAIDPTEALHFSTKGGPATMRVVDMFTPIGRGQRGLIVSPPRTGKTILLQHMAHGIAVNYPDVHQIVMLIDERPEEVTDMRRNVHGEVIASSNDLDVESHVRVARLVIERARRLVENGRHIIVLLDSITRLGRAFNNYVRSSGRTMTGGLDIRALHEPKQIFGSARNVEGGGSLTIIATALIDTGSRADEFIFQEFKGTGNMELALDRDMANLRIWPAVNLQLSGTRKEEKLLPEDTLNKVNMLRRQLHDLPPPKQMLTLLERMQPYDDLPGFLDSLRS
ncbi:MAG: transcription termination factor Rho [Planctomycetes bacterium]|nr:transcription termination factor Rho [Planctomycetota bacterium]